jgi:serine protease Do
VTTKADAAAKSPPGRMFEFGAPGQRGRDDDTPGEPDQGNVPGTSQEVTIGSGFFVSADGYAVTNSHVVEHGDQTQVRTNDGKVYTAKVVGKDMLSDLALIKVDGRKDFPYVKLADQAPRVGDWVLAVGNTFGLGGTVTAGIVSARERNIETGSGEGLLQIDAPINKGDSGGPSFNTRGEVIGVNSMIFSPSGGSVGVAFAVPADTVKVVIPQLMAKGTVTPGWMGAQIQTVTPDLASGLGVDNLHGAIVANVQKNGPAAKAGLTSGDVITSVSGEPIKSANELTKKVHEMAPGSSVKLGMLRNGKENSVTVTLGQMPEQATVGAAREK